MKTEETEVSAETLRNWLEEEKPVMILDVRPQEQREEWSIPGSIHFDAYEKLKQRQPNALDGIQISENIPIVTVCAAGKTSKIAAKLLKQKGHEVYSLQGGMKAWTLSWNTAELEDRALTIVQIRRTGKGCLSYMLASKNEVVVIDASVAVEVYLKLARMKGWTIRYVLDTHIHADHLSRTPELAFKTGASIYMPDLDKLKFDFKRIKDGDVLTFGTSTLKAIHTPGHTMDSTSYFVDGKYLFTGDTLFTNGIGRPDLKADQDETIKRSSLLYDSLKKLINRDSNVLVLPAHINKPVPFNNEIIGARLAAIKSKLASLDLSKEDFISTIQKKIPPTPSNFLKISELNIIGNIEGIDPEEIEAGANRCAIS